MVNTIYKSPWVGMLLGNKRWDSLRRAWAQRFDLDPTQTGHDVGAGLRLMAGLIAYFSLCCLAVAMIGPAWCAWFAILAAFGRTDVHAMAFPVDVADVQLQALAEAQPHAVDGEEEDPVT